MSKARKKPGFEAALEALEEIVAALESDDTTLQKSIALYEEGIELVEQCAHELADAQHTLQVLRKRADGVFEHIDANE